MAVELLAASDLTLDPFNNDEQVGVLACTALPARSAASRQSVCVPSPHVAAPWGSFFRSASHDVRIIG